METGSGLDSNRKAVRKADWSPALMGRPVGAPPGARDKKNGAGGGNRTPDIQLGKSARYGCIWLRNVS